MSHPADPAFPALHARPAHGWVNDPNGCSFFDGRYHVFFQYNPDASVHHAIKWGHASSADLVHWRQEPIALVNRPGEVDEYGCWSGCMVDDEGVPTAVYSAVPDDSGHAEVVLARGNRSLTTWRQETTAVAGMPADPAVTDVRDPFVFEFESRRYAVQGAGHRHGAPRLLVYGCDDLESWTELGPLLTADDPVAAEVASANIWECPNLTLIDGRWVLIVSLWHSVNDNDHSLSGVRYLLGDLETGPEDRPVFTPASGGALDTGPCFYAPQLLVHDHRTLMWAWSWEFGRSQTEIDEAGWAGVLTFGRQLSIEGDALVSRPVPELDGLRLEELDVVPGKPFAASAYDVVLDGDPGEVSLWLVDDSEKFLVAQWVTPEHVLQQPRILVDGSLVEVFGGGSQTYTTRAYPTPESQWRLDISGQAEVRAWRLGLH